jgi:hypothetical protein
MGSQDPALQLTGASFAGTDGQAVVLFCMDITNVASTLVTDKVP